MRRLGLSTPEYAHIPVLCYPDGTKLSKQTGAPALQSSHASRNMRDALHYLGMDTPDGLIDAYGGAASVTFSTDAPEVSFLSSIEGVDHVEHHGRRVTVRGRGALAAHVGAALVQRGIAPLDLDIRRATLEDVFLAITSGEG